MPFLFLPRLPAGDMVDEIKAVHSSQQLVVYYGISSLQTNFSIDTKGEKKK